tara:strand:+ start:1326 stop:1526 length:201 start_codon:yes stop_codon:yes gene_type:complete
MTDSDFAPPKSKRTKEGRTFTLRPATIALVEAAAERHNISASRVVDIALDKYLTRVMATPEKPTTK